MSLFAADGKSYDAHGRRLSHTPTSELGRGQLFIDGDEFDDGSFRIEGPTSDDPLIRFESRENGVWNLTEIEISGSTLHLGHGLDVSGIVDGLLIHSSEDGRDYLVPEIPFDKLLGTEPARTHNAGATNIRDIIQPFDLVDIVQSVFSQIFQIGRTHQSYVYNLYVKVGSTPPVDPIVLTIETGKVAGEGTLFLKQTFPVNFFPANTEVIIPFGQGIGFFPESNFILLLTSETAYSLRGHPAGFPWAAIDEQDFLYEDLLSFYTGTDKIITQDGAVVVQDGNIVADTDRGFNLS